MPSEFPKTIDLTLNNEKNTFAFLDDILIISHGKKYQHIKNLKQVLDKLDQENLAVLVNKYGVVGFSNKTIQSDTDAQENRGEYKTSTP